MHRKWLIALAVLSLGIMCFAQANDPTSNNTQDLSSLNVQHEPPMLGVHWARGFNPFARAAARGSNPDMTYHGGVIMSSTGE